MTHTDTPPAQEGHRCIMVHIRGNSDIPPAACDPFGQQAAVTSRVCARAGEQTEREGWHSRGPHLLALWPCFCWRGLRVQQQPSSDLGRS